MPSFHYIGYALNSAVREEQHSWTGSASTNWLGSLVLAIMRYHFPEEEYELEFFVICLLGFEEQAAIAEVLLAIIGHGYFWTGLGFNIAFCGQSVNSIQMTALSQAERNEKWDDWAQYIHDHTPFAENGKRDDRLTDALLKKERRVVYDAARQEVMDLRSKQDDVKAKFMAIDWEDEDFDDEEIVELKEKIEQKLKVLEDFDVKHGSKLHRASLEP